LVPSPSELTAVVYSLSTLEAFRPPIQQYIHREAQRLSFSYDIERVEIGAFDNYFIVACIHCSGNMFTETWPSNDKGIHIQTHRLIGRIYDIRR
jgi:hypothetical protein